MIPFVVVAGAALAVGVALGWTLRAETGGGAPSPYSVRRGTPSPIGVYTSGSKPVADLRLPPRGPGLTARPYNWAEEPDL